MPACLPACSRTRCCPCCDQSLRISSARRAEIVYECVAVQSPGASWRSLRRSLTTTSPRRRGKRCSSLGRPRWVQATGKTGSAQSSTTCRDLCPLWFFGIFIKRLVWRRLRPLPLSHSVQMVAAIGRPAFAPCSRCQLAHDGASPLGARAVDARRSEACRVLV